MDIYTIIQESLERAASLPDEGKELREIHRNRSKNLVEALASAFRSGLVSQPTVRVLSKHSDANREEFGLNELLFDVLVCDTGKTASAKREAELTFVTKALWVVESEMARDSREALFDFNKLVLATSENKLFIGPQVSDEETFLATLLSPARYCNAMVFVALVPHPDQWRAAPLSVHLWQLESSQWRRE